MIATQARMPHTLMRKAEGAVCLLMAAWLILGSVSLASTITGTVMNLSRNKPAAGDDVVLYRVDNSMHEVMRAKTDARGMFQFEGPAGARYVVAAIHGNVSYHTSLLRGIDPATVFVYDAVPRLAAVHESSSTLFPAREGPSLKITQFFVVLNVSAFPRTLTAPFRFELPRGAVLDSAAVQPPGTLPSLVKASACGARDQYCIASPIRPGDTKVRVIYHLDFRGGVPIALPIPHSVNQLLLKIPESLTLQANAQTIFRNEGQQNGLSIYSIDGLHSGHPVSFALSSVTPTAVGANGGTTASPRAFEWHDAEYEMRSRLHQTSMSTAVSLLAGRSRLDWIVGLGVLMSALSGAGFAFARLARSSVRPQVSKLSLSRKMQ